VRTIVIDNLKAGVLQADWYDPELNPKIRDFATHYTTVILPTKPAMPCYLFSGLGGSWRRPAPDRSLAGRGPPLL
jgi:hypothetical protein